MGSIICKCYDGEDWYFEVEGEDLYCRYKSLPSELEQELEEEGYNIILEDIEYPIYVEVTMERVSTADGLKKDLEQRGIPIGDAFVREVAGESYTATHKYKIDKNHDIELVSVDGMRVHND